MKNRILSASITFLLGLSLVSIGYKSFFLSADGVLESEFVSIIRSGVYVGAGLIGLSLLLFAYALSGSLKIKE
jgi:hypothetical protein